MIVDEQQPILPSTARPGFQSRSDAEEMSVLPRGRMERRYSTAPVDVETSEAKPTAAARYRSRVRVKRRLQGFVVEIDGPEARVAFVENGQSYFYDFPADQLKKNEITRQNQPFQMDEIEIHENGTVIFGHRFLPLARAKDAFIEPVDLDAERKRKLESILKKLGTSKT